MRQVNALTAEVLRDLAVAEKVCVRPLLRRVLDRETGQETTIPIPCGSTRETVCPSCAHKARVLRIQQCAEGWHRDTEPERDEPDLDQDDDEEDDEGDEGENDQDELPVRRVRSTRRRRDVVDLPKAPAEDRTVGRTFTAGDGTTYRPSMFLTLTLPSYGPVFDGVPSQPKTYNYRRAALDAMLFPKLVDRFWQNLRRCAGYRVQYFATVEPQKRLAPHLHAAIRGAIPRRLLRQVIKATYVQVWWPPIDRPVYTGDRVPAWDGGGYVDPDTGELLPTWDHAIDQLDDDPDARPVHVMRFGTQSDIRGIIAPSEDADRAIRYLTKYLTKAITEPLAGDDQDTDARRDAHIDRLHAEVRWLPCSPDCANWLRYGIQPRHAGPGLRPGECDSKAHDREHLGVGGRRVLVSRDWSGKTLADHRADRATVVRETLASAGIVPPEVQRMAADVLAADGQPRYWWTDTRAGNDAEYRTVIFAAIQERRRWRAQYDQAKTNPVHNSFGNPQPP